MNRTKILALFFVLIGTMTQAQEAFSGNGDLKVQAGYVLYGNGNGLGGSIDYGLLDFLSVGGGLDLYFSDDNDGDFYVHGRTNIHLGKMINIPENMDLYPGFDLGLLGNEFDFGGYLGFRYFFTEKLGAFAEIGTRGRVGLSLSL